jgi:hypothetical protein
LKIYRQIKQEKDVADAQHVVKNRQYGSGVGMKTSSPFL